MAPDNSQSPVRRDGSLCSLCSAAMRYAPRKIRARSRVIVRQAEGGEGAYSSPFPFRFPTDHTSRVVSAQFLSARERCRCVPACRTDRHDGWRFEHPRQNSREGYEQETALCRSRTQEDDGQDGTRSATVASRPRQPTTPAVRLGSLVRTVATARWPSGSHPCAIKQLHARGARCRTSGLPSCSRDEVYPLPVVNRRTPFVCDSPKTVDPRLDWTGRSHHPIRRSCLTLSRSVAPRKRDAGTVVPIPIADR